MILKIEPSVHIFRKIVQLNAVNILKNTNEYYRKIISESGHKMDLYPAIESLFFNIFQKYFFWIVFFWLINSFSPKFSYILEHLFIYTISSQ